MIKILGSSKSAKFYCNADSSGSKYKWVKQLEYLPEGTGLVTESINLYHPQIIFHYKNFINYLIALIRSIN